VGSHELRSARTRLRSGQHFLKSPGLARELVVSADFAPHELVVEIGAGTGILSRELAARLDRVVVVELDPLLVGRLRHKFRNSINVSVVEDDILRRSFPTEPYRAFGNIPFNITTRLLRHLLDDERWLTRADVIVQWEVARKRTAPRRNNLLNLSWGPWWDFFLGRRIPADSFRPPPTVDAAVLSVIRRPAPHLPAHERDAYKRLLRQGFGRPNRPLKRELRGVLTSQEFKRLAADLGFDSAARATDLDVVQWTRLYRYVKDR
jgi:23S rRNA (adenine-N6)-dimethyltransferase